MGHAITACTGLALLLAACAPESTAPPGTPAEPAPIPIVAGMLTVRCPAEPATCEDGLESLEFELGCGADGKLALALWDRKGREEGSATRALLGPTARDVHAGERLTLRFEWRVREGRDVLSDFVRPVGGQPAVDAVEAAVPGFASGRVAFVGLVTSDGGTARLSTRFADESVPPASGYRTHVLPLGEGVAEVAAGDEAVLFASAWLGAKDLARPDVPGAVRIIDGGNGFVADGSTVDASRHAGPFWSLRIALEPDARE